MDPNAALDRIRELYEVVLDGEVSLLKRKSAAEALAEQVKDLDEFLTRGGYLPEPWRMDVRHSDGRS